MTTSNVINRVQLVLNFGRADQISALVAQYPELAWLTGEVNATPEASVSAEGNTLSEQAFGGTKHVELDRTLVGIMVLKWILDDDYASFTACQKQGALTPEGFAELRAYTQRILPDDEALDAMVTCMVINDLGKIKAIVAKMQSDAGVVDVDHDNVLLAALETDPEISPSFNRLSEHYRSLILNGLRAQWNGGQGIQGEDLDASWQGVAGLDDASLDFYMLHLVSDVAGAAGQFVQNGSVVMSQDTWTGFRMVIEALELFKTQASATEVRSAYLQSRGALLGFDASTPEGRALTVIGCMLRKFDNDAGQQIHAVFDDLSPNTRAILVREMGRNGVDNLGTLLYYSPALLANAIKQGESFEQALSLGLDAMARLYHQVFRACRKREDQGVVKVMVNAVADVASDDPTKLPHTEFVLVPKGDDFEVEVRSKARINAALFEQLSSLSELPGTRIGVWGIGGGSDGLQAALLAKLLKQAGKDVAFVGSVRTKKTGSQGATGSVGDDRTVSNHGGEIHRDVFAVTTSTTGTGRFLEYLPAADADVYLVLDNVDGTVHEQMQAVIDHTEVDAVILVDTGGDALYSVETDEEDQTKATPDQDLRILRAAASLTGVDVVTCEVACGVDAPGVDDPKDAETTMRDAGARFFSVIESDADLIRSTYANWRDRHQESAGTRFLGKTPLAFEAALDGQQGFTCQPIDEALVLDRANPWHPFIYVDGAVEGEGDGFEPAMGGMFFMELSAHLASIGA